MWVEKELIIIIKKKRTRNSHHMTEISASIHWQTQVWALNNLQLRVNQRNITVAFETAPSNIAKYELAINNLCSGGVLKKHTHEKESVHFTSVYYIYLDYNV